MIKAFGYFFEILKGGWITTRHFVVNMVFHVLRLFGIKTKRRGAVTIQYPEQRREIAPRHRSLHRLMKREDGKPRCVVCMLCATVCPSECIYIEAAEDD
ncbi:MAG: NADH-quinone oxidoreductase subunit I, partial [Acidobacteria bacterium]|nr:NADH-quinone oxidoreductase subunit I [Acidobacteriota bacterium]